MDPLVPRTMKNAAKCDTYCELQDSVNHQIFERILRSLLWIDHAWFSLFKQPYLPLMGVNENGGNSCVKFFHLVYKPSCLYDGSSQVMPREKVVFIKFTYDVYH